MQHTGFVTGLDMTDEQLDVAKAHMEEYTAKLGYKAPNMKFIKGFIEKLGEAGVPDESVDIIMSNCVVNLSPDKLSVLSEAYRYAWAEQEINETCLTNEVLKAVVCRVLAPGGEFYFSDVYCDRRLPKHVQEHEVRHIKFFRV